MRRQHPSPRTMTRLRRIGATLATGMAVPTLTLAQGRGATGRGTEPKVDYSAPAGATYTAEEVTVQTPMGHTLAGTLTLPKGADRGHPVGAIVTITGSGPEERDEHRHRRISSVPQFADTLGPRARCSSFSSRTTSTTTRSSHRRKGTRRPRPFRRRSTA